MHAYTTDGWESLFVAEAGVAAVLAGLLFVAVSINLDRILQHPGLPGRAGQGIGLLATALVVATLGLVAGQSRVALGSELLAAAVLAWCVQIGIHARAVRRRIGPSPAVLLGRIVIAQAAVLPFVVAGVSVLVGAGGGLYWLAAAFVLAPLVAIMDAWVLLVEILR